MICSSKTPSSWGCPHVAYENITNIGGINQRGAGQQLRRTYFRAYKGRLLRFRLLMSKLKSFAELRDLSPLPKVSNKNRSCIGGEARNLT